MQSCLILLRNEVKSYSEKELLSIITGRLDLTHKDLAVKLLPVPLTPLRRTPKFPLFWLKDARYLEEVFSTSPKICLGKMKSSTLSKSNSPLSLTFRAAHSRGD